MTTLDLIHSLSVLACMSLIACAMMENPVSVVYLAIALLFSLVAIGINIYDLSNT